MGIGGDGDILLLVVMLTAVVMVAVLIGKKFFICRLDGCICGVMVVVVVKVVVVDLVFPKTTTTTKHTLHYRTPTSHIEFDIYN